ncbi:MAG: hypothetical protein EA349_02250 [Halomonadaceae bacterium]|nr:MAG: hypothetical protein EA349_02250 [Halomonadaceae bacterium]
MLSSTSRFTAFLLSLCLLSAQSAVASEALQLTAPPWPPMVNPEDPREGLASEIVIAAFTVVDQQVELKTNPWRRVLWLARHQQVDGLVGIWHADAREEFLLFSDPYYQSHITAAYHKDRPLSGGEAQDLKGLRVGARQGAHYAGIFTGNPEIERITASTDLNMLHMLAAGRLEAAVGDRLILQSIIDNDPELADRLVLRDEDLIVVPIHFAMVKARDNAHKQVKAFNRGLSIIRDSGERDAIIDRYR